MAETQAQIRKPELRTVYPARPGDRTLTIEDLWRIPRVGVPCPSPTRPELLVAVRTFDMEANRGRSRVWLVPAAGSGEARPLTSAETDSDRPAFSPDGASITFVRKEGDKGQLYLLPRDGGEAEPLTDLPLGVLDARWLPDGSGVVVVAELLAGHLSPDATRTEFARREKEPEVAVVTEERLYRFWDRFLAGGRLTHLFFFDLATRSVRDLTPDLTTWLDLTDPADQYDVSPDGLEVALSAIHSEGPPGDEVLRSVVYTVATAGGPMRPLTAAHACRAYRPRYTPDGRGIVYGWSRDPSFYADRTRLSLHDRASGEQVALLHDWDRSPSAWEVAADGTIYLQVEVCGRTALHALDPGSSAPRPLTQEGSVSAPRIGHDGRIYLAHESLVQPAEVFVLDPAGTALERRTHFTDAALAGVALGEVRDLGFAGAEGEWIQAWLVLPPGHREGEARPLVHLVHGGPHGQTADGFHPRWNAQLFAAPGYVVACVNFQGSSARGQDFAARIRGAWGDRPFGDVMAATDVLIESGLADPARMAVTGASYGGYLVAWITTQTDRFRCAVNHAGVYDLLAQYATDVTHARDTSFGGTPWKDIERIDAYSPSRHMAQITTPMLVMHGQRDFRVPVTQGLECYNVLKAKGVPARLVLFHDENHWVLKPRAGRLFYHEVQAWLARHLGPVTA